jgi:hypothetical protein
VLLPGFQRAGISRILKEKGREQFRFLKKAICVTARKNAKMKKTDRISLLLLVLDSIKLFPISFNTLKTL